MTESIIPNIALDQSQPIPTDTDPNSGEEISRKRAGPRLLAIGGLVVVALAGGLTAGIVPRLGQQNQLDAATTQAAAQPPRVTVAVAQRMAPVADRVLPGNSLPLMEAALYARATGFVSRRLVDIGDQVKEGQLLAEISAPDIDDQLAQAKANLVQAQATLKLNEANAALAKVTLTRYESVPSDTVAPQEMDQQRATFATTAAAVDNARAAIQVNQAMVQRFIDLKGFEKITAPFTGVITARNVETGDLITADSTSRELFHLMRTDTLRVFVDVPQAFATSILVNQTAAVYRREEPGKQYPGTVTRTANALVPNTRTLLTEVDVPNPENVLRPGMYLQVKFAFERKIFPLMIPAAALITRSQGAKVAALDDQHRVHYRDVELGRDYGADIQVVAGLKDGETVVVHPGDDIPEGTVVEPVPLPK
jgi:RND family efflux transporter MFP subunit